MTILIVLAILTAVGCWLANKHSTELLGIMVAALAGVLLFIALIGVPFNRMEVYSNIAEFQSVRATITAARSRGESLENAAMQLKVAETNAWLANAHYWNQTLFDIWIPDVVMHLEPIR